MICEMCPRNCQVNREKTKGFCSERQKIKIAKIIENFMWEEPCISGKKGALAIFFSGCNLRCEFCQNYKISHNSVGKEYTPPEFYNLLNSYDLTKYTCIDLITPTHFSYQIISALKGKSLPIPVVWNSSGYEKSEVIEKLGDVIDVFMPDFKYFEPQLSLKYSLAEDYFSFASKSIVKMRQLKKSNIFKDGILQEGVLIRHMPLPGHVNDSLKILDFISKNIDKPFISLMSQFTPYYKSTIKRKLYPLEYKIIVNRAINLGLTEGYIQDFESSSKEFIPRF